MTTKLLILGFPIMIILYVIRFFLECVIWILRYLNTKCEMEMGDQLDEIETDMSELDDSSRFNINK